MLGVHYPLDIMGGRLDGEAGLAARWSDAQYRTQVLQPARAELVGYLEKHCGAHLSQCVATEQPYADNPYGGRQMPGGTAEIVTDRPSALLVYTERLTYGFAPIAGTTSSPSVPAGAGNLLLTAFPTLTDAQRTSVLAQTEIKSGYPLDGSQSAGGSWQRLNLAAALSATVKVHTNGSVTVLTTGGAARVIQVGILKVVGLPVVYAGGQSSVTGSGFVAGQSISFRLNGDSATLIGAATADSSGRIAATVTVPGRTPTGARTIDALDAANNSLLDAPVPISVAWHR